MRRSYSRLVHSQAKSVPAMAETDLSGYSSSGDDNPDKVELIVKFNGDIQKLATGLNAEVEILYQNYAIITIEKEKIPQLYAYVEIENIELPKIVSFEANLNLVSTCVKSVQDANSYNLTGKGTIVAIIDSGIDYTHKDFQNEDGTTRILYLWDQTISGAPPEGFLSGAEYTREQINEALESENPFDVIPSTDTNGHGTAVAGIAVGNGRESGGENTGVAPEADIISVRIGSRGLKSFARTTEIMRGLKYVIGKAKAVKKPVAVNISVGTNNGAHNGTSLFETYISDISADWKTVIVVPTGNEGSAGHHFESKIETGETKEIEFFTAPGIDNFYISLWKNFTDSFKVQMVFPDESVSEIIGIENQVETIRKENLTLSVIYGQPTHYSKNQEIFFNAQATTGTISPGVWKLRIIADKIVDGNLEMWLPTTEEVTEKTFFSYATIDHTLTIPSTAAKVITVAGYNDRLGSVAQFSGRGSAGLELSKPDIAAPAVGIISTMKGGGYDTFTGTSISAPFVAGAAALMMQWGVVNKNDLFLYGERVKAFLRLGARRSPIRNYPNNFSGYGTLCVKNTMDYLVKYKLGGITPWLKI